jgi:hypothetical protein
LQDNLGDVTRSFEQEMSRIPVRNISCLALELATEEHVYGAVLLDLLGLCSSIQRLQVTLNQYDNEVIIILIPFFIDIFVLIELL